MTLGILVTFADPGDVDPGKPSRELVQATADEGWPLVVDSGAFSVFTGKTSITPEQHAEWVLTQKHTPNRRYIGLDVIGDPEATLANYRVQRGLGAPVEPTVHYGDPVEQVDRLLEVAETGWLNIGGLVPYLRGSRNLRNVAAFLAAVRRRTPSEVKLHALGCTTPWVLRQVHVDAVDSSSWLNASRYRQVSLFDSVRGQWRGFPLGSNTSERREGSWSSAYRRGGWLRSEYGIEPGDLIDRADDRHFILTLAIAGVSRFAEHIAEVHGKPVTMYLAGSDPSNTARCDAVRGQRSRATEPEVPA